MVSEKWMFRSCSIEVWGEGRGGKRERERGERSEERGEKREERENSAKTCA